MTLPYRSASRLSVGVNLNAAAREPWAVAGNSIRTRTRTEATDSATNICAQSQMILDLDGKNVVVMLNLLKISVSAFPGLPATIETRDRST